MGQIQRVTVCAQPPGSCMVTGKNDGEFFDLGVDFWNEFGRDSMRAYLSAEVVGSMAAELGWASPERVDTLRRDLAEAQRDLDLLNRQVAEYEALDAAVKAVAAHAKPEPAKRARKAAA